ncbi:two-component system, chemotaxis family, CheB/CheR fusion protein [Paucidesulfovibrio gracilis DSM 16080]|uniref:Two-component system, chemotaxis family, CheB/CheR fusion protein n=1 Tax=Paucidesulfovibrio gracilis DSM 16080 TaxID=1121449 RepID=A0A1T4Y6Z3_9BACT|nr:chemotaxis protein CheB [Paucidesulfovibrio gracilis]SKA97602.1 two-component system, chemotaxis family, CheB/CheR fusion protein [Paucidesulfovibrio gracilis DSM 16080]
MATPETLDQSLMVVGIGASAGGLEALQQFFSNIDPIEGVSFVVVQHLSPDYKSLMPELLARKTRMQVRHVVDGEEVLPGVVYILPPKNNLTMYAGKLFLTPQEPHLNLPIDLFFRSLAEDRGENAVGIILSGTGSDGTRGVRAIKEHGGLVLVQEEESATFDGMPRSAISTGIVDFVLPPDRMAGELRRLGTGLRTQEPRFPKRAAGRQDTLGKILALVKIKSGLDFSYYKENTIIRRIERRMSINQVESPEEYAAYLEKHPGEIGVLYKEFLIGVTKFFREPEAYECIAEKVLPELFNAKDPHEPLRIWVAGCSTGEEAYSLAITVNEYLAANELKTELKIFATDIDRDALAVAAQGAYPLSIAADASLDRLGRYFFKKGEVYQIQPHIRKQVIFAYHNLIKDPPFPRIDLVSCRNLLIYLQPVLQRKVLSHFQYSLAPQGFLFLGSSESVGDHANTFFPFENRWKLFRYHDDGRPRMPLPVSGGSLSVQKEQIDISATEGEAASPPRPDEGGDTLTTRLLERCMPPTLLVGRDRTVQHIFGDVNEFVQMRAGRPQADVTKIVRDDLAIPLSSALQRATKEGGDIHIRGVAYHIGEERRSVDIVVRSLGGGHGGGYLAVTFQTAENDDMHLESYDLKEGVKTRIRDLERELQYTKENLQATIEELETSNEELQATNEELLAANEELQSTNEELQSVNEELITVNAEYQSKIQELTELNDDLDNLMASTEVGTIFLDQALCIRKFTSAATVTFKIIDSDVGRPISDLSHRLQYPELEGDLRDVLGRNRELEREVRDEDGRWYLARLLPYASGLDDGGGVLLTLVDISRIKRAEESTRREHDLLIRILDSSPMATTMVDKDGFISYANRAAEAILGVNRKELAERRFNDGTFHILDCRGNPVKEEDLPFSIIKQTGDRVVNVRHAVLGADGERICLSITGNPVFDRHGRVEGAVFKFEPVPDLAPPQTS